MFDQLKLKYKKKKANYQIYPKSPRIENSLLILPFLVVKDNGQLKKKKKKDTNVQN